MSNESQNTGIACRDAYEHAILGRQDIDPIQDIVKLLQIFGHKNPDAWTAKLHPDASNPDIEVDKRRFLVNRYWHTTLGLVDEEDTSEARYCLVDKGQLDVWLILFKQSVMPTILRYNL